MRLAGLVAFAIALCSAAPVAPAGEEPAAPPATPDEAAWKREADELEERAAQAEAARDLEAALSLRRTALARVREHGAQAAEVARRLDEVGSTLYAMGRLADARSAFEEVLAARRGFSPGDHADVAASLNQLAMTLVALGKPADALPLTEESLAMRRRLFPGDHPEVARGLHHLANVVRALGAAERALPLEEEALAMRRRLVPGDHPDVASNLGTLASTLEGLGRHADALRLQEEALAMNRRLSADDHPGLGRSLDDLARTLVVLGRPADALPLHQEALAMRRRLFRGDHPHVAVSLVNLASTLDALGRSADALPLREEALAQCRRLFGRDHPGLAASLAGLANTLSALGRSAEALPLSAEALRTYRRLYRGDHPDVARALGNLASVLEALGRSADALPLEEEALAIYRRLFPTDHPDVARSVNNLAHTLVALGKPGGALPLHQEATAMYRRLAGRDHPDLAASIGNVASAHDALGRPADALPLREEALAMHRRLFRGDHPWVASSLDNLASTLKALRRPGDALSLEEEAVAMYERIFHADHPDVARLRNNVGATLDALGRLPEALRAYEEAYAIAARSGSPDRYRWGTNLGRALLRTGRARDARPPLEAAAATLEAMRSEARGLRGEDRVRFVEALRTWGDPYSLLVRVHVALSDGPSALGALERGRGREMLDALLRGSADPISRATARARERGDPDALRRLEAAEEDRRKAEAEVVVREAATDRARSRTDATRAEVKALADAEAKARRELLEVLSRAQSLVKEVLPEARPLSSREVQALLAPDERLLAHSLGEDASYAFVVSPSSIDVYALETEGKALTSRTVAEAVGQYGGVLAKPAPDVASVAAKGRTLFAAVVPQEAWDSIRGAARVYVMPHGPLNSVPFETLVVGDREGKPVYWADVGPPLAYEPSASVLSALRERPRSDGSGPDLVAVGDPVFAGGAAAPSWPDRGVLVTEVPPDGQAAALGLRPGDVLVSYDGKDVGDPASLRARVQEAAEGRTDVPVAFVRDGARRVVQARSGLLGVGLATEPPSTAGPRLLEQGPLAIALRSAAERGRGLAPLPATRREVQAISDAFRAVRGDEARVTTLLGKDATESAVFEATRSPRFLHFATHGLVDETETASFSALALTVPAVPVTGDDGTLTLVDLFSRWQGRLRGTELVVLSACESTKGKATRDESMYALPWGFLFAGARSVVGSLWRVDDDSTAFLMTEFYRRLLSTHGADPLAALSAARLATKAKYPHPYYWGAFVLSGAPR
jgi:tetratricopeptide (TPR) repeat protein